jgi:hypothetical protein
MNTPAKLSVLGSRPRKVLVDKYLRPFAYAMLDVIEKGKDLLDGTMSLLALAKDVGEDFGLRLP